MEYENNGWATFGKVSAWVAGLATAGTILYFGVTGLYNAGYNAGESAVSFKTKKELAAQEEKIQELTKTSSQLEELTEKGHVIPKDSCLSYSTNDSIGERIKGCGYEFVLENKISQMGSGTAAEMHSKDYKIEIDPINKTDFGKASVRVYKVKNNEEASPFKQIY